MGGMRTTVHSSRQNANGVHRPEHLDEEGTQKEKMLLFLEKMARLKV